jgi:hypothetical protein
MSSDHAVAE